MRLKSQQTYNMIDLNPAPSIRDLLQDRPAGESFAKLRYVDITMPSHSQSGHCQQFAVEVSCIAFVMQEARL